MQPECGSACMGWPEMDVVTLVSLLCKARFDALRAEGHVVYSGSRGQTLVVGFVVVEICFHVRELFNVWGEFMRK